MLAMFSSKCVQTDILYSCCLLFKWVHIVFDKCLIGVWVVYGPGPLGRCSMSPVLVPL